MVLQAAKLAKIKALKEKTTAAKDRKNKAVALAAAKKLYAQAQREHAGLLKTNFTAAKATYDKACNADATATGCVELKAAVDTFMQQVTDADAVVATADAAVKDADAEVAASTAAAVKAEAAEKAETDATDAPTKGSSAVLCSTATVAFSAVAFGIMW